MSRLSKALKKVIKPVALIGAAVAAPAVFASVASAATKYQAAKNGNVVTPAEGAELAGAAAAPVAAKPPAVPVNPESMSTGLLTAFGSQNSILMVMLLGFALILAVKK